VALEKARITSEKGTSIACMFNPAELTIARSTSWGGGEAKGGNAPELRFQGGQSGTLSLSLTFDTTDTGGDVSEHTNALLALMDVDSSLPGSDQQRNSGRPPWVQLHWGKLHSFEAIVERVQVRYTYFADGGTPLRAKAEVSLKQYKDDKRRPLQNPTSHTDVLHATHRLVAGETLDRVAARYYRDPTQWRVVADANGVVDPLEVPPGTLLAVPELPVRHRA
jgi:hypothetical protein